MPVRPRVQAVAAPSYPAAVRSWLEDGKFPAHGTPGVFGVLELQGSWPAATRAWEACRGPILRRWARERPGRRPWGWWEYEAPRWIDHRCPAQYRDTYFARELCVPRRRVGGIGTARYEVLNDVPRFAFGLPESWVDGFEVRYYSGRAVDVRGNRIGGEFAGHAFRGRAVSVKNPPTFESECSYLRRFGLLSQAELSVLTAADYEAQTAIELESEDSDEA